MDGCRGANCNAVLSLWNLAASDCAANIVRSAMKRTLEDISLIFTKLFENRMNDDKL